MIDKLKTILKNSYAPYSKFHVAAIVVMNDGTIIGGVNVENASYGSTICAEKTAIVNAISSGYKSGDFKEIHLTSDKDKLITPCGSCRQVINEMFDNSSKIFCYFGNSKTVFKVDDLLPYAFSRRTLK